MAPLSCVPVFILTEKTVLCNENLAFTPAVCQHTMKRRENVMEENRNWVPLSAAMRMSVLNILLNVLLVGLKAAAGIFARSTVLLSDAVHSAADTFCTVLVMSGIGFAEKRPGHTAERIQGIVISLLAVLIAATGVQMCRDGIALFAGSETFQSPGAAAVAVGAVCVAVKGGMYVLTRRCAVKNQNEMLLADAFHHRADCASSLLVLISVGAAFAQIYFLDAPSRILLGCSLLFSAGALIKKGVQKIRSL